MRVANDSAWVDASVAVRPVANIGGDHTLIRVGVAAFESVLVTLQQLQEVGGEGGLLAGELLPKIGHVVNLV